MPIESFSQQTNIGCIHPAVLGWMLSEGAGKRWCVGCSGGTDSIFLVCYLWAHFPERRRHLNVLHFNHKLRGEESDEDERFVREFCEKLGIPLISQQLILPEGVKPTEGNLREARYSFFYETLRELGSTCLFLGHQKNDILETMLMRLARGSGIEGLCAPHPITHIRRDGATFTHLRPLLTLSKGNICSILRDLNIPWREDASNQKSNHLRNLLRNRIIPEFQKGTAFDLVENAARSRELLEEDNAAINDFLKMLIPSDFFDHSTLDCTCLIGKPKALLRRAVSEWLSPQKGLPFPSAQVMEALLDALMKGTSQQLACNADFYLKTASHVLSMEAKVIRPIWPNYPLQPHAQLIYPDGKTLSARLQPLDESTKKSLFAGEISPKKRVFLDAEKLPKEGLLVKQWQNGDCYKPLGLNGSKKLQDCFIDCKIPQQERHRLPIVWASHWLLWCPGIPPADDFKVDAFTKNGLILIYCY